MKANPRVLIVEDDSNNHPLFHTAFSELGFEVKVCQTAEGNFLDEVARFNPDIISMDLMIGKAGVEVHRDGFQATELLKTDERTKSIPVIVVTNFFDETKVKFARSLGAVDYLNLQGLSISKIAEKFKNYLDNPKKYKPSNPLFREE